MKKYIKDTIDYYDNNIEEYNEKWGDNFLQNYNFDIPEMFLSYLKPKSKILDLGCGIGRDSIYFKKQGHDVTSIDGSKKMCELASKKLNQKVEQINFLDIDYKEEFDGIFAAASLLHLSNEDLISVLNKIDKSLKKNGIIFASFKLGNEERIKNGRYFNDMTEEKFLQICKNITNLKIIKCWVTDQYQTHKQFINLIIRKEG